ncbi:MULTISPECIES: formylglycine-generating enzyme family protein [unclassified Moorena]|uniref:formylglycine-generating enzyme family protein n=1 Tax=unclassified Moorena TaxID=2683338 RepID=UPI0013C99C5D|nr:MULTISPECIES: formylglycine-generating enzyme family protein [unclassified Moorena]NEO19890.1 formylglycine-generating enzyme family protein [Moorena sp. SIO4A5]NEQ57041.1 formylglycine-generating enzyme family protein [Moorena sp. SIO4A1]
MTTSSSDQLTEEIAKQQVERFVARFEPNYRYLACHCALPLVLTPELVNYIRVQFLLNEEVPWIAEADLLLSELCRPVGYELYAMTPAVRSHLLAQFETEEFQHKFGTNRLKSVAQLLMDYVTYLMGTHPPSRQGEFQAQQWAAMVYLDQHRTQAEEEIAKALQGLVNRGKNGQAELARLQRLIQEFRPQLSQYDSLMKFAESLGIWLNGKIPPDASQSYGVHGVNLSLNQVTQLEGFPPMQTFECEVVIIGLGAETEIFPEIELEPFEFEVATIELKPTPWWFTTKIEPIIKSHQQQADGFTEDLGNGVDLEMVAIPEGSFIMGSPETEEGHRDSESPQHQVAVKSFFMGKYPVTQAQWQAVAALTQVNRELKPNPSYFKGDDRPVERVSWDDAVEFCERLSEYTKRPYRLPSEAQWEYACRAGTTTPFHFGETITTDLANYDGNYTYGSGSKGKYVQETTPAGSFGVANDFGLYDMHGNVWEWCADHWHSNYKGAPTDGSAWEDESINNNDNDNISRLLRGGSWRSDPGFCRSGSRPFYDPVLRRSGSKFGFRVVCGCA